MYLYFSPADEGLSSILTGSSSLTPLHDETDLVSPWFITTSDLLLLLVYFLDDGVNTSLQQEIACESMLIIKRNV